MQDSGSGGPTGMFSALALQTHKSSERSLAIFAKYLIHIGYRKAWFTLVVSRVRVGEVGDYPACYVLAFSVFTLDMKVGD